MVNNCTLFKNESASSYFEIQENTHPGNVVIAYCALNVPLMLMSIVGNVLETVTILRTPLLLSPSTTLLCNLAFTDLLIGIVVQPLFITKELKNNHSSTWISDITSYSLCKVSLWTMTVISMDRFAALHINVIRFHSNYIPCFVRANSNLAYHIIGYTWSVYMEQVNIFNSGIRFHRSMFVDILILLHSNFSIVHRHQMQIHAQQQVTQNSEATDNLNITKLKKSTINTFVFYTFLLLCYVPLFIFLALLGIVKMEWQKGWNFAVTLVSMISSINAFLFCWRLSKLRRAVLKTARKMSCTKTD